AHGVELDHLALAQLGDDQPASRAGYQQAAPLQPLQRLAHRRAADPEAARDLLLAHALAAADTAFPDRVAQAVVDEVTARAGAQIVGVDRGERALGGDRVAHRTAPARGKSARTQKALHLYTNAYNRWLVKFPSRGLRLAARHFSIPPVSTENAHVIDA